MLQQESFKTDLLMQQGLPPSSGTVRCPLWAQDKPLLSMPWTPGKVPGATAQSTLTSFCQGRKPLTHAAVPSFRASWCTINLLLEAVSSGEVVWRGRSRRLLTQCVLCAECKSCLKPGESRASFWPLLLAATPEGPAGARFSLGGSYSQLS